MKSRSISWVSSLFSMLSVILLTMAGLSLASATAFGQDNQDNCSAATLQGPYGIQTTGSIVAFGPPGPVVDVGVITFDGVSEASLTSTVSLNGAITSRSSLSGSYTVNPDCTGDVSLVLPGAPGTTITSKSHFVIVNQGEELFLVNTGTGRVLAGDAKKQ